jgi:fido (protein-threonine AMPylation protein)
VSGAAGPDPYLDPASGVLHNRLGITDAGELAQAEAALSASRIVDLERRRLPGRYDLAHLRAFHRLILGDVYDWAGELRTVSFASRNRTRANDHRHKADTAGDGPAPRECSLVAAMRHVRVAVVNPQVRPGRA